MSDAPAEIDYPLPRGTAGQVHAVRQGPENVGVGPFVGIGRETQPLPRQIARDIERAAFVSPMKAPLAFAGRRSALARSIPTPPRFAAKSVWISSTGSPSNRASGICAPSARAKYTSDTRIAAAPIIHGSSFHASKMGVRQSRPATPAGWLCREWGWWRRTRRVFPVPAKRALLAALPNIRQAPRLLVGRSTIFSSM